MLENGRPSQEGMNINAQKFEEFKSKVNLSYANRIKNPIEYGDSYSGICDVIKLEEAHAMADKLRGCRKDPNRKVMIGVMASRYSLNHDDGDDMVCRDEISSAFTDDPDVLNTIHYADLYNWSEKRPWNSNEAPDLPENLELCVKYGGENLHAIQLDLTWPSPEKLKEFKEKHPNIQIILQTGKFSLAEANNDPLEIVKKLREYGDSIDYVLLDMSMGKGIKMDGSKLLPLLSLIQFELPGLGLAVAGGLGPDSVDLLKSIAAEFPNISIDAQGRLKADDAPKGPSGHFDATTPADLTKSNEYIEKACALLDTKKDAKSTKTTWV